MSYLNSYFKRWDIILISFILYFLDVQSLNLNHLSSAQSLFIKIEMFIFYWLSLRVLESFLIGVGLFPRFISRLVCYGILVNLLIAQALYYQVFRRKFDINAILNIVENFEYWSLFATETFNYLYLLIPLLFPLVLLCITAVASTTLDKKDQKFTTFVMVVLAVAILIRLAAYGSPSDGSVLAFLTRDMFPAGVFVVRNAGETTTQPTIIQKESRSIYVAATDFSPNVLIVLLESVRKDYFEKYILNQIPTSFTEQAANYEYVYASSPSTVLSLNDVFGRGVSCPSCKESVIRLVQNSGIETMYYSSHWNDWSVGGRQAFQLLDFDYSSVVDYPDIRMGRPDSDTLRLVKNSIDSLGENKRFLSIIHLNDTHYPYHENCYGPISLKKAQHCYELSLIGLGEKISDFLRYLQRLRLLDRTVIIIISDHGESFGEKGYYFHGSSLSDAQLKIPLLVYFPQSFLESLSSSAFQNAVAKVATPVSAMDIAPTLLDIFNIESPNYFGESLFRSDLSEPVLSYLLDGSYFIVDRVSGCKKHFDKYNGSNSTFSIYGTKTKRSKNCAPLFGR
ncbi:MAG: sulfatase-like hydrolase/transferase [Pseudomonadales bacterium]|nr:sulfatase-like hydrolase/transferase [Pseudomonadales bacterium]